MSFKCCLDDLLQYTIWYCDIASSKNLCNDILDVENPSEVKFTLEQATKDQRESRGIALLFP